MPGGFPLGQELCNGTSVGVVATSSIGTTITTASANTKTAYTQIVSSTASDTCWAIVLINCDGLVGNSDNSMIDIAVGASGSEKVIVSNLVAAAAAARSPYSFPIDIPAGTRISARAQTNVASSISLHLILFDGAFTQMEGAAGIDAIGANTTTTEGTLITASATANTKGSYSQLTASTTEDYIGLMIGLDQFQNYPGSVVNFLFDIAIGASGSEKIIVPDLSIDWYNGVDAHYFPASGGLFIPCQIPAGTRIAARTAASTASQFFGLTVYGVYQ